MENLVTVMVDSRFWRGKRVFVTGHSGFKGSWLSIWLHALGAEVTGYALPAPTEPSLFAQAGVAALTNSLVGDVRDRDLLRSAMEAARPEVVFHLAAQPLVRESYLWPAETFATNVMGTVNLLEAVRSCPEVKAVVNVTTDKCYENREWLWGYREDEPLGGYDPYSSSKACSELVTSAYRRSFFNTMAFSSHGVALSSARAGNVIGGGDWARDRLLPDCVRAILAGEKVAVRNPNATRPWQHVLEPLCGYLILAERLFEAGPEFAESWNFGPKDEDALTVGWMVETFCRAWGPEAGYEVDSGEHPHEANFLKLDCSKARGRLGWRPRWSADQAVRKVVEWTRAMVEARDLRQTCLAQIEEYTRD